MLRKYPFYIKSTVILFGLSLFVLALFVMRDILIPLAFAGLLAILLNPLVNWFRAKKMRHGLAVGITVLLAFLCVTALVYFLSSQVAKFGQELPALQEKSQLLFTNFQQSMEKDMHFPIEKQDQWLAEAKTAMKPFLGHTLGTVLGSMAIIFLLPVYCFLFLYYKTLILNFIFEVFSKANSKDLVDILHQIKGAIQNYTSGLLIEAMLVAALDFILLWTLGIKYALLLAVICAILNILPYIGGLIAICLPLAIATLTKDGFDTQILLIIGFLVIQFIDNNFLVPMVVSSKVRINALISILIVLLGGSVWDVSGMFLSIPFIGVLKLIFDRVPELKPWGKLLGDEIPVRHKGETWRKRLRVTPAKKTT